MGEPKYECPYSWGMYTFIEFSEDQEVIDTDSEDGIFFLKLMNHIMVLCESVIKKDYNLANKTLGILENIKSNLIKENLENGKISIDVVIHVLKSTMYYSLEVMDRHEEAFEMEKTIQELKLVNFLEVSTLSGCKSAAWSKFYEEGAKKAILHANEAKKQNPKCGLWFYLAGLNTRRLRRTEGFNIPSFLERRYFHVAYELCNNPIYAVSVALCYKESREHKKAIEMYMNVKKQEINNCNLYCKLALGFTFYKLFDEAKDCLDKAEKLDPNRTIFLHYKGLYLMKLKKYDEAEHYLRESGKDGNFRAEMNLFECIYKNRPKENLIHFLKSLFKRYDSEHHQIHLWLHIAMYYYEELKDIDNSLLSFQKAIVLKPESGIIKNYFYPITKKNCNIYQFLQSKVLVEGRKIFQKLSPNAKEAFDMLNGFTHANYKKFDELSMLLKLKI